jgi:hypothetical protein
VTLRPFPVAALARALNLAPTDTDAIAAQLHLNRRTINRYRTLGLTLTQADEWSRRAGLWPGSVWPTYERLELRGVALVNAGKETCGAGHPLDRVDAAGRRRCTPCPRAAVYRYRARKMLVVSVMTTNLETAQ